MSKRKLANKQSQHVDERHLSGVPSREYAYKGTYLLNTALSKNMNVDGSVTPVDFKAGPAAGELWYVERASFLMIDPGDMDFNVFGSLATALVNGIDVIAKIDGTEGVFANIKDNASIAQCLLGGVFGPGGSPATDPGFLNEVDWVAGKLKFPKGLVLDGDDGDELILRVNDALGGLLYMGMSICVSIPTKNIAI